MADRVAESVARAGVPPGGVFDVVMAYATAMSKREAGPTALSSDRHPAFLHPGRTILILADDLKEVRVPVLVLGALAESRDDPLKVSDDAVLQLANGMRERSAGEELQLVAWWRTLPRPVWSAAALDDEDSYSELIEEIVVVPEPLQRVVLAEALDQLRHAHLWDNPLDRRRAVELAGRVLGPLAARLHPTLDRRYSWWLRRVGPALA